MHPSPVVLLLVCCGSAIRTRRGASTMPGSRGRPQRLEIEAAEQDAEGDCAPVTGNSSQINAQLRKPDSDHPYGKVRPCGYHQTRCPSLEVVDSSIDYPGRGDGDLIRNTDYIVQFDVGTATPDPEIPASIWPDGQECLEVIMTTKDAWGDLGVPGLRESAYNCMGSCGEGCRSVGTSRDCGKHDVCSAYKSVHMNAPATGFCNDADCGDEAAQTIYNCRHTRLSDGGRYDPAICNCEEPSWTSGSWSTIPPNFFEQGNCRAWQGCEKGEGIPMYR